MAQGPSGVQVDLNGTDYVDGDAVELESGVAVSISMAGLSNVAGFYTFDDWESNVGNFTNSGATSTTFTPFHANGAVGQVAGVMNDVSPTDNTWSGYVVDEADTSTPITCVGGSLYLQPYAYVGAWPDVDLATGWVRLGGFGQTALIQAGIQMYWQSSGSFYWFPFLEAINSSNPSPGIEWVGPQQDAGTILPDFNLTLCDSGRTPTIGIEAWYHDSSGNWFNWWNETGPNWFQPGQYVAEWVIEDALQYPLIGNPFRGAIENFYTQPKWVAPSWTAGGVAQDLFLGPLTSESLSDDYYGSQYLAPNQIAHQSLNNFLCTYST